VLLYVIRHGQTDWNAEGRLQGQTDIPLNDFGRAQATGNGEKLAGLIDDPAGFHFVASPLGRTRETMERIRTAMGLAPLAYSTDERLKELSFGDWEGQTLREVKAKQPERLKARSEGKWGFIPPGSFAESYEILSWRVGAWLKTVDRPTICVCHGGVIRSLFRIVGDVAEEEAATMGIPQDVVLRVDQANGRLDWI
jgi:probable phosphoglycerate mutase